MMNWKEKGSVIKVGYAEFQYIVPGLATKNKLLLWGLYYFRLFFYLRLPLRIGVEIHCVVPVVLLSNCTVRVLGLW
eukprot:scaffold65668_cov45-Cyclotella_meneghiniana.AAC.1